MAPVDERLLSILVRSQDQGFLGPGDLFTHVEHARAHAEAAQPELGQRWCDLGTGGGVPGLLMALEQPGVEFVLLDRSQSRIDFLDTVIGDLDIGDRVTLALGDAAELAHRPEHRYAYDGVVSRAFGPPAAVAECSVGLLRPGGRLVVSEPPNSNDQRWPAEPLAQLGLYFVRHTSTTPAFAVMERQSLPNPTYPRTWKQIRKRPLF